MRIPTLLEIDPNMDYTVTLVAGIFTVAFILVKMGVLK